MRENRIKKLLLTLGLCGLGALFMASCSSAPKVVDGLATQDITGRPLFHQYVVHPQDSNKQVEFYWQAPQVPGTFPVVFVLHGHQDPDRPGGAVWTHGWMQKMVDDQFITVAISMPGNGNSDGPADYCGPFTQRGIREVIRYFKTLKKIVDPKRMAVYGVGRGATCAALVATEEPSLKALVLQVGMYDLKNDYQNLLESSDPESKVLAERIKRETGAEDGALEERSVLPVASKIKMPTLILTGEHDAISGRSSLELAQALQDQGTPVQFLSYKKQGHVIPERVSFYDISAFLEIQLQDTGPIPLVPASDD